MIPILILIGALALDFALGDPRSKYHPTAWVGTLIAKLVPMTKSSSPKMEKIGGLLITILITGMVTFLLASYEFFTKTFTDTISMIAIILIGMILLKTTIAIRGLEQHGNQVMESISQNNLDEARSRLSMLVKRSTKRLGQKSYSFWCFRNYQ